MLTMNNFPNLKDLDNNTVFIRGVFGTVHVSCSPWSTQELDAAYANSKYFKEWVGKNEPILGFPTEDCNVCQQTFAQNEMIMLIPATLQEVLPLTLKKNLENNCQCPNLLNGHSFQCALSQNLIFEKK